MLSGHPLPVALAPFAIATARKLLRCRGLFRVATSPQFRPRVRSTRSFLGDYVMVATTAGRPPCCRELNSLSPRVFARVLQADALAHPNRSHRRSKYIRT